MVILQDEKTKSWKKLIRIVVSGAAGMISNHLLFKVTESNISKKDISWDSNSDRSFLVLIEMNGEIINLEMWFKY